MTSRFMIISAILLILSSCSGNNEHADKPDDIVINVESAQSVLIDRMDEFPFIVKPYRTSALSFRVSGPADIFDVTAGNFYKKGDVIARIDPRDFIIRNEKAMAVFNQAKAEFERSESLYKLNNISANAFEKAQAAYLQAKTAYDTAQNELVDTRLIAPFDGYVGEVYIEKYQDVKASQSVLTFVELSKLKIETYVPLYIVNTVQNKGAVEIVFDDLPQNPIKAEMPVISKSTTSNNLSYLLTLSLDNSDYRILAGMSGKVIFRKSPAECNPSIIVPQKVLCHRPTVGDYVWVVDSSTKSVERRAVKTGEMLPDGTIEVIEGLKVGEMIASSGLRFLNDSTRVNIKGNESYGIKAYNKETTK